jgi:hypothetical protein
MRRAGATLVGVIGLASIAPDARAQTPDDLGADRRDVYLRLGGGAAYSSGSFRFSGMSQPIVTPEQPIPDPPTLLSFQTTLHGPQAELDGALGHAIVRGVAVAGALGISLAPVHKHQEPLGATTLEGALAGRLGLLLDVFPLLVDSVHFMAAGGWSKATFIWSQDSIGSPDNIVDPETVTGPYGELGVGYRLAPRFDLMTRVGYAALDSEHSTYRPLAISVLASYLRF